MQMNMRYAIIVYVKLSILYFWTLADIVFNSSYEDKIEFNKICSKSVENITLFLMVLSVAVLWTHNNVHDVINIFKITIILNICYFTISYVIKIYCFCLLTFGFLVFPLVFIKI